MILFLSSSPRKNGTSATLLKAMKKAIGARDTVEWIDVHGLSLAPCTGCLRCRPDKPCALPRDDAHRIAELIQRADALVIGAPTYWGNVPGPLKIVFDRIVPVIEYIGKGLLPAPMQKGKPAALVVSASAPFPWSLLPSQTAGAVRSVKTVLNSGGFRLVSVQTAAAGAYRKNAERFRARTEKAARRLVGRAEKRRGREGKT